MNIKEIVDQEKQKELFKKSKRNQEKHLKKLFFKDCYQMWKDYKKVENPFFWWLGILSVWKFSHLWCLRNELPTEYYNNCDLHNKWDIDWCSTHITYKIKRKTNPNDTWIYLD